MSSTSTYSIELRSEFGHVEVTVDHRGNGPRLRVQDIRSGEVCYLDPLILASLAGSHPADLAPLLDPGQTRWATEPAFVDA